MPIEIKDVPYDASLEAVAVPYGYNHQLRVSPTLQAAQPLVADKTVYCDSVSGNDANAGSQAAPFQTFARAWQERQKYGVLRARFTIQLLGAGPYSIAQELGASLCDAPNGYLVIAGDTAAETTHYTGSFTGDFAGVTINTSAGLGADTHKNKWIRITSGACAGAEFVILEHTDAQVVAVNRRFRLLMGAIVSGDTFKVFTPGTVINNTVAYTCTGWAGGMLAVVTSGAEPRHVFHHILFTGTTLTPRSSVVNFVTCRMANGYFAAERTITSTFMVDAVRVLGASNANLYRAAAIVASTMTFAQTAYTFGPFSCEGTLSCSSRSYTEHTGGRVSGAISVNTALYQLSTSGTNEIGFRIDATISVQQDGFCRMIQGSVAFIKFAVTAGHCFRVYLYGKLLLQNPGVVPSGGTSDPAGFAVDVSNGGQCLFQGVAPTLTGGTAGKDLKTTNNGGVPNSTLSAAGTAAGTAADALLGEVLARVA